MENNVSKMKGKHFDIHMHHGIMLSSLFDDKTPFCQNIEGIIHALMECDLDYGVVFPFPDNFIGNEICSEKWKNDSVRQIFEATPYFMQNRRLIDEAKNLAKNSILPVPMFSIKYNINGQLEFLNECISEKSIYGLKYYPEADGMTINDLQSIGHPFLEFLMTNNMPLFIHSSADSVIKENSFSRPEDAYYLADRFPDLRICIAHMGHFSKRLFTLMMNRVLKNFYLDTSPFLHLCNVRNLLHSDKCFALSFDDPTKVLLQVIDMFPDNIVWGSDSPFNFTCNLCNNSHDKDIYKHSIQNYSALLHSLPIEQRKTIASINSINLLFGENNGI